MEHGEGEVILLERLVAETEVAPEDSDAVVDGVDLVLGDPKDGRDHRQDDRKLEEQYQYAQPRLGQMVEIQLMRE